MVEPVGDLRHKGVEVVPQLLLSTGMSGICPLARGVILILPASLPISGRKI